jgi:hypothetical protein
MIIPGSEKEVRDKYRILHDKEPREDDCLLECCTVKSVYPRFRGTALIMEAVSISETSVKFYHTTRRNNPEDNHLHNQPKSFSFLCFRGLSLR